MKQKFKVWGITGLILLFLAVLVWAQFYPPYQKTITDNKAGTRLTIGTIDADTTAWIKFGPATEMVVYDYFAYLVYGDSIAAADDTSRIQIILQGTIDTLAGDRMFSAKTDTLSVNTDNIPAKVVNAGALPVVPFYRFILTAQTGNDSFLVTVKTYFTNSKPY